MYRIFKTPEGYKARQLGTKSFDVSTYFECADWQSFQRELQYRINNEYEETQKEINKELQAQVRKTKSREKRHTSESEILFDDRRDKGKQK